MPIPRGPVNPRPQPSQTTEPAVEESSPLQRSTGPTVGYEQIADEVSPLSSADLLSGPPIREFILIGGKDGVGKSSAIVSVAAYVEMTNPEAKFYVIDSENKFRSALRSFGETAPTNIVYYKTENMNQVTWATAQILKLHKPGDWLGVESMSRIWERAQDLGYNAVTGLAKAEYMDRRREAVAAGRKVAVTPQPDNLWNITKGAHDGAFLDLLTQSDTLNVIMSTIQAKPPKESGFMKENQDRRAVRQELGIDCGLEGSPRLPYYVETLCLLELKAGLVTCRVLRDNLSVLDQPRIEFDVEGRRDWAASFWQYCRTAE